MAEQADRNRIRALCDPVTYSSLDKTGNHIIQPLVIVTSASASCSRRFHLRCAHTLRHAHVLLRWKILPVSPLPYHKAVAKAEEFSGEAERGHGAKCGRRK